MVSFLFSLFLVFVARFILRDKLFLAKLTIRKKAVLAFLFNILMSPANTSLPLDMIIESGYTVGNDGKGDDPVQGLLVLLVLYYGPEQR